MSPPSVQHCASKVVSVTCYVLCSLLLWSISEDTLCVKCLNCWTNFRVLLQRPSNWKHTHSDILNIVQQHWKMKSLAHATPVLVYPKPLFIPLTTWAVFFSVAEAQAVVVTCPELQRMRATITTRSSEVPRDGAAIARPRETASRATPPWKSWAFVRTLTVTLNKAAGVRGY